MWVAPFRFRGIVRNKPIKTKETFWRLKKIKSLNIIIWSSFFRLRDQLENYAVVMYKLEQKNKGQTVFTWQQEGFAN